MLDGVIKLVRGLEEFGTRLLVKRVATEQAMTALYGAGVTWVAGAALGEGDPAGR